MRRDAVIAMSGNLTLYVSVPEEGGGYRTLRSRMQGRPGRQTAELHGEIRAVRQPEDGESLGGVVRCGAVLLSGDGEPAAGKRLAVGIVDGEAAEVSSSLAWKIELARERWWLAEPLMRAYRNGDRRWQEMLTPRSYEMGDEEVEESELREEALERYYQGRLEAIAKRRERIARRRGFELRAVVVPVSSEDLADALAMATGEVAKPTRLPMKDRRLAGRAAASIDVMLGTVKHFGEEAAEELLLAA